MTAVSKKLRFAILSRDGFSCRYCGKHTDAAELHVDHVIPRALGGSSDASNLVAACADCNSGKADMTPDSAGAGVAKPNNSTKPLLASEASVQACTSEQDAIAASVALSGLTYRELAARMGVSKSLVNAMVKGDRPLSERRTQAFCNATGTTLVFQYRDMDRALRESAGRQRERDRLAAIVAPTQRLWSAAA